MIDQQMTNRYEMINRYEDTIILTKFVPWHFFYTLPPSPSPILLLSNFSRISVLSDLYSQYHFNLWTKSAHFPPPICLFVFRENNPPLHSSISKSFTCCQSQLSKQRRCYCYPCCPELFSQFLKSHLSFLWLIKNYINLNNLTQLSSWNNISNQLTLLII